MVCYTYLDRKKQKDLVVFEYKLLNISYFQIIVPVSRLTSCLVVLILSVLISFSLRLV